MIYLLQSPLCRGAYFADTDPVSLAELEALLPGREPRIERFGDLTFVAADLGPDELTKAARLSWVQGLFRLRGDGLQPLKVGAGFELPAELVFGAKYRGKTHELVTQLGLNLALEASRAAGSPRLLDPMAGRGTTLLWAARYGVDAKGIELDPVALDDLHRHVKRQCKLQRIKHEYRSGQIGKKQRDGAGRFVEYGFETARMTLISGDSRDAASLLGQERFSMLVSDLPYGVQFHGKKQRSPLDTVRACAQGWVERLRPGASLVLIYNQLQPSRHQLSGVFTELGVEVVPWQLSHRMSESIWRDLLVLRKPL